MLSEVKRYFAVRILVGAQFQLTIAVSFVQPDQEVITTPDLSTLSSPLIDTERNLGLLLGLHASYLAMSTPLSPLEIECASKQDVILSFKK